MHWKPEILNTNQGSRFTSQVFNERVWRYLKHEYLYLNQPGDGLDLYKDLKCEFIEYNSEQRQNSLKGEVAMSVYSTKKRNTQETVLESIRK